MYHFSAPAYWVRLYLLGIIAAQGMSSKFSVILKCWKVIQADEQKQKQKTAEIVLYQSDTENVIAWKNCCINVD